MRVFTKKRDGKEYIVVEHERKVRCEVNHEGRSRFWYYEEDLRNLQRHLNVMLGEVK